MTGAWARRAGAARGWAADGRGAGPRRGRSRRGSTGCSAAAASREHQAAEYAVPPDRLRGVARARGLVLAAAREQRRDQPLVDADRRDRGAAQRRGRGLVAGHGRAGGCSPTARRSSSARATRTPVQALALGELARFGPRHDDDVVVGGQRAAASRANASRSRRLTRLRSTAPPTLRETDRPRRGPRRSRAAGRLARERVEHEVAVAVRPALAVDALELRAARQPAALGARALPLTRAAASTVRR